MDLREKLLDIVSEADDELLEVLYEASVGYGQQSSGYELSKEQIAELHDRVAERRRLNYKGASMEDVLARLRSM